MLRDRRSDFLIWPPSYVVKYILKYPAFLGIAVLLI